jgi:hypothetical protein
VQFVEVALELAQWVRQNVAIRLRAHMFLTGVQMVMKFAHHLQ